MLPNFYSHLSIQGSRQAGLREIVLPEKENPHGIIFGAEVVKLMLDGLAISAAGDLPPDRGIVIQCIHDFRFLKPVHAGECVSVYGDVESRDEKHIHLQGELTTDRLALTFSGHDQEKIITAARARVQFGLIGEVALKRIREWPTRLGAQTIPDTVSPSSCGYAEAHHLQPVGIIKGSAVIRSVDLAVAYHASLMSVMRREDLVVTASIRDFRFYAPVLLGDVLTYRTEALSSTDSGLTFKVEVKASRGFQHPDERGANEGFIAARGLVDMVHVSKSAEGKYYRSSLPAPLCNRASFGDNEGRYINALLRNRHIVPLR